MDLVALVLEEITKTAPTPQAELLSTNAKFSRNMSLVMTEDFNLLITADYAQSSHAGTEKDSAHGHILLSGTYFNQ